MKEIAVSKQGATSNALEHGNTLSYRPSSLSSSKKISEKFPVFGKAGTGVGKTGFFICKGKEHDCLSIKVFKSQAFLSRKFAGISGKRHKKLLGLKNLFFPPFFLCSFRIL